jgi:alanine-synthesizing transaminase
VTFSRRLPDLARNRLAVALDRLAARGASFLDLTETNPTRAGLDYPADLLAPLGAPACLSYDPEPRGLLTARQAVAAHLERLGSEVSADDLLLTASTSEAYGFLFKLLCDPGDEVLVPTPSYPLFEHLTMLEDVRAVPYGLDAAGGWSIDLAAIERHTGSRTRAVLVVSPNNPTGSMLGAGEIDALSRFCASRDVTLIGDEVFADYRFATGRAGPPFASVLSQSRCLTFGLGGLSKSVGLPQIKLAWIAVRGPEPLRAEAQARLDVIADTYLSVGTPVQCALPDLFARGAEVRRRIQDRIERNLTALRAALARCPALGLSEPAGGWSAAIRVPATRPEEDLVVDLLERHAVRVLPGYFFDFRSEAWIVVSLLVRPGTFDEGLERLLSGM